MNLNELHCRLIRLGQTQDEVGQGPQILNDLITLSGSYLAQRSLANVYEWIGPSSERSPEEYREQLMALDASRRRSHNALIAQVRSTNRWCEQKGIAALFAGDLADRRAVAQFTLDLLCACTQLKTSI